MLEIVIQIEQVDICAKTVLGRSLLDAGAGQYRSSKCAGTLMPP